ncbi:FAS1-like dehydratase domain-containing protein [Nioella nitratireducens]|uniref:FAS1-like dehydratase domain-containing protein n=1 Tax=Nioella nitratireducens TaxID=1287720 RepID=UPI0008FD8BF6|nr:MaoC family dehydratase N-terminal domain-containing protein [Nioella nitratireducens]
MDTKDYAEWIGRSSTQSDTITPQKLAQLRVTLGPACGPAEVPGGMQWCIAPDLAPADHLGRDGHPRPGLVLPALPLPRRMWAGGALTVHKEFSKGDVVTRKTTIRDVAFKQGRSGPLGFVTVEHFYAVDDDPRLSERQDIVYRQDPVAGQERLPEPGEVWHPLVKWHIAPDATLLFRFSALTFNGHRIHYDHPYATGVEGYAGLVVHGPLQATWMQNLAAEVFGHAPTRFSYRGLTPLIVGDPVSVEARKTDSGLALRVRRARDGVVTMQADAEVADHS